MEQQAPEAEEAEEPDASQPIAVVDTNVLLDIQSSHDLADTYDKLHATLGEAAITHPSVVYRRERARGSMLLALYFNRIGATTYSLRSEGIGLMTRMVPAGPLDGSSWTNVFTTFFVWFVSDYLLPNWVKGTSKEPGGEVGNAADRALLDYAKENGLPIITNEGNKPKGLVEEKMRKLAKAEGVPVFAPSEFYAGKMNEAEEIDDFLRRFQAEAPRYIAERKKRWGPDDKGAEVLDDIYGYYRLVLLGKSRSLS